MTDGSGNGDVVEATPHERVDLGPSKYAIARLMRDAALTGATWEDAAELFAASLRDCRSRDPFLEAVGAPRSRRHGRR